MSKLNQLIVGSYKAIFYFHIGFVLNCDFSTNGGASHIFLRFEGDVRGYVKSRSTGFLYCDFNNSQINFNIAIAAGFDNT
jgi:hypothetical protein